MDNSEIRPLLKLLDDENAEIVSLVRGKLLEKGSEVLPFLDEAGLNADPTLRERIQSLISEIAAGEIRGQLQELAQVSEDVDLESGVLLLARYGYPTQDLRWCIDVLDQFSHELDSRLDTRHDPIEIISVVVRFFGTDKGFKGDTEDYYNPENSYIDKVLEKRTGLPISLCTIYLLVARRLNIPLYGVGMPGHFLLKYKVGDNEIFVDPFREGKLLSRNDCREFLEVTGLGFRDEFLEPVTNRQILDRMIRNLLVAYRRRGELQRLPSMQQFLEILQSNRRS